VTATECQKDAARRVVPPKTPSRCGRAARFPWAELNRSDPEDKTLRARVMRELLGAVGERA
jgi:hypothetical protein